MNRPTFTAVCSCGFQGYPFPVTPSITIPRDYAETQAHLHQRASGGKCNPIVQYQSEMDK